jgi:hypothetical protein
MRIYRRIGSFYWLEWNQQNGIRHIKHMETTWLTQFLSFPFQPIEWAGPPIAPLTSLRCFHCPWRVHSQTEWEYWPLTHRQTENTGLSLTDRLRILASHSQTNWEYWPLSHRQTENTGLSLTDRLRILASHSQWFLFSLVFKMAAPKVRLIRLRTLVSPSQWFLFSLVFKMAAPKVRLIRLRTLVSPSQWFLFSLVFKMAALKVRLIRLRTLVSPSQWFLFSLVFKMAALKVRLIRLINTEKSLCFFV